MDTIQPKKLFPVVPWKLRDLGYGMIYFILCMAVSALLEFLNVKFAWNIELGVILTVDELLLLFPVIRLAFDKYQAGAGEVGFRKFALKDIGLGLLLLLVFYFFNILYAYLVLIPLNLESQGDVLGEVLKNSLTVWAAIGICVVGPVIEEIFFRGFLYGGLRQKWGWKVSALLSSTLFALLHLQPLSIFPIFVIGFSLAFLYERCHSIWPCIFVHAFINSLSFFLIYLSQSLT